MEKNKTRNRIILVLFILLALSFPFLIGRTPWAEFISRLSLEPILQGSSALKETSQSMKAYADSPRPVKEQMDELKERLYQAEVRLSQMSQLLPLLPSSYRVLGCPIILNSTCTPHQRRIFIAGGRNQGIQEGQAVLGRNQVVGKIKKIFPKVSQVQLLTDGGFKLSVRVQRTRKTFVLETFAEGKITLKHVQFDEDIRKGDVILTTGWEGKFPPSIRVGTVSAVEGREYRLFLKVTLSTTMNPLELEQALVLLPSLPELKNK